MKGGKRETAEAREELKEESTDAETEEQMGPRKELLEKRIPLVKASSLPHPRFSFSLFLLYDTGHFIHHF